MPSSSHRGSRFVPRQSSQPVEGEASREKQGKDRDSFEDLLQKSMAAPWREPGESGVGVFTELDAQLDLADLHDFSAAAAQGPAGAQGPAAAAGSVLAHGRPAEAKLEDTAHTRATGELGPGGRGGAPGFGIPMDTSLDEDVFAPGTLLEGKFEVLHKLGQGAMGTVYLAMDTSLKRKVAVKTLSSFYHDPQLVDQFRTEAESMAKVQHPNVVQIYSYGEHQRMPYFVMELVDGESLAEAIDRRELTGDPVHVDEAVGIISQVCRGLSAIHARGIVHRDVKPANIMITSAYRVALTDFGLVGRIADAHDTGLEVHGTPVYLAPERIDTKPVPAEHAHLCDIYALGIVLYEFLTFRVPFDHPEVLPLLTMHMHDPPPRPSRFRPDLPTAVEEVILRALAKSPAERFESAEGFRRALLDAREDGSGRGEATSGIDALTAVVVNSDAKETLRLVRATKKAYPGATVLTVSDGQMGLEFVREFRPDVILLDSQCEGLNPLELLANLQGEELVGGPSRVLLLSERDDPLEAKLFKELGVTEVLHKPVPGEALVRSLIRTLVRAH